MKLQKECDNNQRALSTQANHKSTKQIKEVKQEERKEKDHIKS